MTLIVTPKNKKEEKILKAFLSSVEIGFHAEADEDAAMVEAMKKGIKTPLLNDSEKKIFFKRLKAGK